MTLMRCVSWCRVASGCVLLGALLVAQPASAQYDYERQRQEQERQDREREAQARQAEAYERQRQAAQYQSQSVERARVERARVNDDAAYARGQQQRTEQVEFKQRLRKQDIDSTLARGKAARDAAPAPAPSRGATPSGSAVRSPAPATPSAGAAPRSPTARGAVRPPGCQMGSGESLSCNSFTGSSYNPGLVQRSCSGAKGLYLPGGCAQIGHGRCTFAKGTPSEYEAVFGDGVALDPREFCSSTGGTWSSK
jgi:hypothetical protein